MATYSQRATLGSNVPSAAHVRVQFVGASHQSCTSEQHHLLMILEWKFAKSRWTRSQNSFDKWPTRQGHLATAFSLLLYSDIVLLSSSIRIRQKKRLYRQPRCFPLLAAISCAMISKVLLYIRTTPVVYQVSLLMKVTTFSAAITRSVQEAMARELAHTLLKLGNHLNGRRSCPKHSHPFPGPVYAFSSGQLWCGLSHLSGAKAYLPPSMHCAAFCLRMCVTL